MLINVANVGKFYNSGSLHEFTESDLALMANTCYIKPITIDFNFDEIVGTVMYGKVLGGKLYVEAKIHCEPFPAYLVPMYSVPSFAIIGFGITTNPAQTDLESIPWNCAY